MGVEAEPYSRRWLVAEAVGEAVAEAVLWEGEAVPHQQVEAVEEPQPLHRRCRCRLVRDVRRTQRRTDQPFRPSPGVVCNLSQELCGPALTPWF